MGRSPCCENGDRNKGAWTTEEDEKLIQYIHSHGEGCWRSLPKAAGLLRCGKSCRLRWINYLRPDLKRGNFSEDEEDLIFKLHALLGNNYNSLGPTATLISDLPFALGMVYPLKWSLYDHPICQIQEGRLYMARAFQACSSRWSLIAGRLPGRTDNEIKNYWNSHLKRKLLSRGVDPKTHRPFYRTITQISNSTEPDVVTQPKSEMEHEKSSGETVEEVVQSSQGNHCEKREGEGENVNLNLELSITSPSMYASANEETMHSNNNCHGKDEFNGINSVGCYADFPRTMLLLR